MGKLAGRQQRTKNANELIGTIASCGRKFFNKRTHVSFFELQEVSRLFYVDGFRGKRVWTHSRQWFYSRNIGEGGTLAAMLRDLQKYIMHGSKLSQNHFYWKPWICNGDLWGYGDDMEIVRKKAVELGIIDPKN